MMFTENFELMNYFLQKFWVEVGSTKDSTLTKGGMNNFERTLDLNGIAFLYQQSKIDSA